MWDDISGIDATVGQNHDLLAMMRHFVGARDTAESAWYMEALVHRIAGFCVPQVCMEQTKRMHAWLMLYIFTMTTP